MKPTPLRFGLTLLQQIVAVLVAAMVIMVAAGLLGSRPAHALEWLHLSETKSHTYEGRTGSFRVVTFMGEEMLTATLRITKLSGNREITFERLYVRATHCEAGEGKLIATRLDGRLLYSDDFIFGGGNAASVIAQLICIVAAPDQPTPQSSRSL